MGITKRLIAAALSCAFVGTGSATVTAVASFKTDENILLLNNNTFSSESKALTAEAPFPVFDIYDAYREANQMPRLPADSRLPNGQYLVGIDVSEHQSYIDWNRVKNSGQVDFAILRAGYGQEYYQKDKQFDNNIRNIQAAGLDYGIYWYSYAMTVEGARREAEVCMSMLEGYSFNYPVYFDIEEISQRDNLSTAEFSAIVDTFCSTLEEHGYFTGIYSYGSMLETKIYKNVLEKYDVWVASYTPTIQWYTGDYGIWQYTSNGYIDGISTRVDLNYCYRDYPGIIGVNPVNGKLPPKTSGGQSYPSAPSEAGPKNGVKLSAENGSINWSKLKSSGVDFALVKAAESDPESGVPAMDTAFYKNIEGAKSCGIDLGVYWHSRGLTVAEMEADAEWFSTLLYSTKPEYPVYLDMTDEIYTTSGLSDKEISELVSVFCSCLEKNGFYVGIYGTEDALSELDPELFNRYDVWLSVNAGDIPTFEYTCGITGISGIKVSGIDNNVELLCSSRNYPSVMKNFHLNGF